MSIGFVIQVLLAGVATARGWSFIPWLILAAIFLIGLSVAPFITWSNADSWVMFLLLIDGAAMVALGIMAFVGRSQNS